MGACRAVVNLIRAGSHINEGHYRRKENRKSTCPLHGNKSVERPIPIYSSSIFQIMQPMFIICRYVQDATLNSMERARRFGSFYSWTEKRSFGIVPREKGLSREGGTSNSSFSCCLFVELRLIRLDQLRDLRGPREERKKGGQTVIFLRYPTFTNPQPAQGFLVFLPLSYE